MSSGARTAPAREVEHTRKTGRAIARARQARGWTQSHLAQRLGIPRSRVVDVELARSSLSRDAIADAVGITGEMP